MQLGSFNRFLLFYPLVVFAICLAFIWVSPQFYATSWGREQISISALVAFVFMGNFAHNFFSFWQLGRLAEFKEWTREYRFYGLNIWQLTGLVYLFFLTTLFYALPDLEMFQGKGGNTFYQKILVFLFILVNTHHSLRQTQGIGIGLSHQFVSKEKIPELTKKEKIFYHFLVIDWILFLGTQFVFKNNLLKDYFLYRNLVLGAFFLWISWEYFKLPRDQAWIKFTYNLRHLYRFFFSLHPILAFLSFALHGADAMLIYWRSLEKSHSTNKTWLKWEFLLIYAILGVAFVFIYLIMRKEFRSTTVFLTALFLTHYIVEGFMYRMKNPVTRKYVSGILS